MVWNDLHSVFKTLTFSFQRSQLIKIMLEHLQSHSFECLHRPVHSPFIFRHLFFQNNRNCSEGQCSFAFWFRTHHCCLHCVMLLHMLSHRVFSFLVFSMVCFSVILLPMLCNNLLCYVFPNIHEYQILCYEYTCYHCCHQQRNESTIWTALQNFIADERLSFESITCLYSMRYSIADFAKFLNCFQCSARQILPQLV